jgi:hypothetical protein
VKSTGFDVDGARECAEWGKQRVGELEREPEEGG